MSPLIKYSAHALKRMAERSILQGDVEAVLASPLEAIPSRYGRTALCGRLTVGYLVVICDRSGEDFLVITAVKVDRERARRYGFVGV